MSLHKQNLLQRLIGSVLLLGFFWIGTGDPHLNDSYFLFWAAKAVEAMGAPNRQILSQYGHGIRV